ncbi:hypothetical protein [Mucilaginibacter sp.]|nr:hypothetical protein [Mucilaginibacter sp.]
MAAIYVEFCLSKGINMLPEEVKKPALQIDEVLTRIEQGEIPLK